MSPCQATEAHERHSLRAPHSLHAFTHSLPAMSTSIRTLLIQLTEVEVAILHGDGSLNHEALRAIARAKATALHQLPAPPASPTTLPSPPHERVARDWLSPAATSPFNAPASPILATPAVGILGGEVKGRSVRWSEPRCDGGSGSSDSDSSSARPTAHVVRQLAFGSRRKLAHPPPFTLPPPAAAADKESLRYAAAHGHTAIVRLLLSLSATREATQLLTELASRADASAGAGAGANATYVDFHAAARSVVETAKHHIDLLSSIVDQQDAARDEDLARLSQFARETAAGVNMGVVESKSSPASEAAAEPATDDSFKTAWCATEDEATTDTKDKVTAASTVVTTSADEEVLVDGTSTAAADPPVLELVVVTSTHKMTPMASRDVAAQQTSVTLTKMEEGVSN